MLQSDIFKGLICDEYNAAHCLLVMVTVTWDVMPLFNKEGDHVGQAVEMAEVMERGADWLWASSNECYSYQPYRLNMAGELAQRISSRMRHHAMMLRAYSGKIAECKEAEASVSA